MRTPRPSASERPPVFGIYPSSLGVTATVVVSVSFSAFVVVVVSALYVAAVVVVSVVVVLSEVTAASVGASVCGASFGRTP